MRSWRAALVVVCIASSAHGQHFATALPAGEERGALGLLEDAQAPASAAFECSAAQTRWWGLDELQTRAVSLAVGVHSARLAVGLSQTGAPEIGFTAIGCAAGVGATAAGAGLRAASWIDRAPLGWSLARATSREAAYEAGAGAWLAPVAGVRVWVSAPQLVVQGGAPPLERAMELGVRVGHGHAIWSTLRAPRPGDDGERAFGGALAFTPLTLWIELRDAPLRSASGLRLVIRGLECSFRLDSHPVLGESLRSALTWRAGGSQP